MATSGDELAPYPHLRPPVELAIVPGTGDESVAVRLDSAAAASDRAAAAEDRARAAEFLQAVYRDELTGALMRRAGRDQLAAEIERARRASGRLVVAFVDVDGLKRLNDQRGHGAGDVLLAAVGSALRESLRPYDLVIRYGGDEFVCALPGASLAACAQGMARARQRVAKKISRGSFSVGYAELQSTDSLADVVRRADADMYARRALVRPKTLRSMR